MSSPYLTCSNALTPPPQPHRPPTPPPPPAAIDAAQIKALNALHKEYSPVTQKVFKRGGGSSKGGRALGIDPPPAPTSPAVTTPTVAVPLDEVPKAASQPAPANATATSHHPLPTSLPTPEEAYFRNRRQRVLASADGPKVQVIVTTTSSPTTSGNSHDTQAKRLITAEELRRQTLGLPTANVSWQSALQTLKVCLDAGLEVDKPLAVLSECALQTLRAVQRYEVDAAERRQAMGAAEGHQTKVTVNHHSKHGINKENQHADPSSFPSWSVRSRLNKKTSGRDHNYMRLPTHALTNESHQQNTVESSDPTSSSAGEEGLPAPPEIPAFLTSRSLSDALLLVSSEGGPKTVRRDATVIHCVLDILDVPRVKPTVSGVKSDADLLAEARRREIAAVVTEHRNTLLSPDIITRMARLEHRNGHWVGALRLLQKTLLADTAGSSAVGQLPHVAAPLSTSSSTTPAHLLLDKGVPPTSPMITTGIEIFAAAKQWELALSLIKALPGTLWQETEVSSVIKVLAQSRSEGSWAHALEVFEDATTKYKVPLSAPSNVNHLLGMLGRANKVEEAARVVEAFVNLDASSSTSGAGAVGGGKSDCTDSTVNSEQTAPTASGSAIESLVPTPITFTAKIEGNAHTISQICVAFKSQWSKALTYASAIIARNKSNPRIVDGVALAKLTMVCSEAKLWEEGLKVLELSERCATPMDPASYAAVAKLIQNAEEIPDGQRQRHTAFVAACVRKHHSRDVFGKVLNTLIQSVPMVDDRVPTTSGVTAPSTIVACSDGEVDSTPAADNTSTAPTTTAVDVMSMHYNTLIANDCHVETASLQRMLEAHCRDGDWVEGLRLIEALRERSGGVTAAAHDAVQFAMLEPRASLTQPHWEVAVRLYDSLTTTTAAAPANTTSVDGASPLSQPATAVPLSEVAFRSCMRLCFSQGATEAAQRLLRTTMQRGIGGGALRR